MIRKNPALPDIFMLLERKESFGDYARAYGDALAKHYENNGVIVVPFMPIAFDLEFLQLISLPRELKKIGTAEGIEQPLVARQGTQLDLNRQHPFLAIFQKPEIAIYMQSQVATFNAQLRQGLSTMFPKYYSLKEANITWRLTETHQEGMHLDIFRQGAPLLPADKESHRLKLFINIDTEPRLWRISRTLPDILKNCRDQLPPALPDDVNVINNVIDRLGVLKSQPYHEIAYPGMSAVIANGETVSHEVIYGRRTVAAEFFCDKNDMLNFAQHSHLALKTWLKDGGYALAPDAAAVNAQVAHRKGSYEALMEEKRAQGS
ncbi:MAG: hypothetical protein HY053_03830 [Proteobacteria bacterium]|nr:hypothetical protein [Pseudomonadota bacterium]